MIKNHEMIDDEIDVMPFIITIFKNYKLFILSIIIAFLCAFILNEKLSKKYRASTSFIIPKNYSANSSASGLLSINNIFNKTFSSQQESVYSTYLPAIISSYRIKEYVAKKLLADGIINDDMLEGIEESKKINYIIGEFQFGKNISLEENIETKVFYLEYSHTDQSFILPILDTYKDALIALNELLNIDANKLELIELDSAKYPEGHYFPKFINIYIIILGILWFLLTLIIVVNKAISLKKNNS